MLSYMIAFTMRSGSNLLCDYLTSSGLGEPTEYFQHPFGIANKSYYDDLGVQPDDFKGFISNLVLQKSKRGVFGAKMAWDHKNALLDALNKDFFDDRQIIDFFLNSKWIYLRRKDRFAQAISLWRAIKSGQWLSTSVVTGDIRPPYDFFGILHLLQSILTEEYLWSDYFLQSGISPLQIFYEDFIENPRQIILDVIRYVRGEDAVNEEYEVQCQSSLVIQRDEYSDELKSHLIRDLYAIGVQDHWMTRNDEVTRWDAFFRQEGWRSG